MSSGAREHKRGGAVMSRLTQAKESPFLHRVIIFQGEWPWTRHKKGVCNAVKF